MASAIAATVLVGSIVGASSPPEPQGQENEAAKRLKRALATSTKDGDSKVKLDRGESLVAMVSDPKQKIEIYGKRTSNKPEREFNQRDGQDGPLVFGVTKQREHRLKVMLPKRPNGSTGWVLRRDVDLSTTSWKVKVDLSDHTVAVKRGGKTRDEWSIGLGQPEFPTPTGEFYTTELIKPKEEGTIYGAYVFVLSGYSEKLTDYAGGNGELGLHGTNDNSGLGSDVSNGCIRMRNAAITKLANRMPLGTPVEIVK